MRAACELRGAPAPGEGHLPSAGRSSGSPTAWGDPAPPLELGRSREIEREREGETVSETVSERGKEIRLGFFVLVLSFFGNYILVPGRLGFYCFGPFLLL